MNRKNHSCFLDFSDESLYDEISKMRNELYYFVRSDVRREILIQLADGNCRKKEILKNTNFSYSKVSYNLKLLVDSGMVCQINDLYFLKRNYKKDFDKFLALNNSINGIYSQKEFLNKHRVLDNALFSLRNLGFLESLKLESIEDTDIGSINNLIKESFCDASWIKSIFPLLRPSYVAILQNWLESNVEVELIIPNDVSETLIGNIFDFNSKAKERNRQFKIKSLDYNPNLAIFLSDQKVLIGGYKLDGSFNSNEFYISSDKKAVDWAWRIFDEYSEMVVDHFLLEDYF